MLAFLKQKIYKSSLRNKLYCSVLRMRLRNKDFTIICNNCWAWGVYVDLDLPFTTPTIGLFFYAPCYIKFLKNIRHYLQLPLSFKDESLYPLANERRTRSAKKYPIGVLDDIEVHFMHYKNETEAIEKWSRRAKRINFDNVYYAFSDTDLCTVDLMKEFDALNFKHKVIFSSKNHPGIQSLVWLKCYEDKPYVGDIANNKWSYRKYFNVVNWLNKQ